MQPFDYVSGFGQNPMGGLMGAMEAGQRFGMMEQQQAALRAREQMAQQEAAFKLQQQQAASLRQQMIEKATQELLANPNRTATDVARVGSMMFDEKQQASLRADFELFTKEQQQRELSFMGQVYSSLVGGQQEIAAKLIRERATGLRNRGEEGKADALEAIALSAEVNPVGAEITLSGLLNTLPGGDKVIEGVGKAREQRRQEALSPAAVREAKAKAQEAEIKLKRLDAIQEAELRKARSEAERNEVLARFASRREQAQLDLTNAQAAAQRASADRTEAELQKLKADADKGPIPEFNAQAGGFIVRPSKENPRGGFIPLTTIADEKSQQGAIKALRTAGYDPETGEDDISRLIKQSTGGMLQTASTEALRFLNVSTPGRKAIAQLEATANAIVLDMNNGKLGAGISNADREFLVNTLGNIGNPLKPVGERLAAWNSAKNRLIVSGMIPPPKSQQKPAESGVDTSNPLLR